MGDTIVAIATSLSMGAIAIIRLSGSNAIELVNNIFLSKNLTLVPTHTIHYGHIHNQGEIIDEVLVMVMRSPKTYTKEDIVEINCHGGIVVTERILKLILEKGARLALPGEFTKRAFLNGRINLVEAEGVMDLISAKTNKAAKLAFNQVKGELSVLIKELKKKLLTVIANIEVNIDYPVGDEMIKVTEKKLKEEILKLKEEIEKILIKAEDGKIIKEGINILIIGRPNVGKSSILNKLLKTEKAIVTDIPGTTRDVIEGSVDLDGILLNFYDTAGIRATTNLIEKIGVDKGLKLIEEVDLIILVLNNNEVLTNDDYYLLNLTQNRKRIIFINKNDLQVQLNLDIKKFKKVVKGNTIEENGLDLLKLKIKELFNFGVLETSDFNFISNARQLSLIKDIQQTIIDLERGLEEKLELDVLQIDLIKINQLLNEIIGEEYDDELLNHLFNKFCVGK